MQFLKTIFWIGITIAGAIFAFNNWTDAHIALWGGMVWDTKLPVPLLIAFLIGLLPAFLLHRATRWSLTRKLNTAERALAENKPVVVAPSEPSPAPGVIPPGAAPIAVPPGV
jgi:lipopolysaccharide assembly protein A